ncbi:hypothetical protein CERZMDRAFT_95465 [Cercospora zeae-maydis SCOH1-5]|uniref:C3H1-type domain-containing protein n=1 Tax=Cercospora zeae-maydis SCOH1-5 TaxID=717836 RepID=A0A6A6FL70_9PEZI|nr:hypothetical protein CERZMDRAFT_95465 [Cercospora zeae-maydis SCOH1-5]
MVVCKFYQDGRCRYGDSCRNEHPGRGSFQQPPSNRFAPLSNQGGSGAFGSRGRPGNGETFPRPLTHGSRDSSLHSSVDEMVKAVRGRTVAGLDGADEASGRVTKKRANGNVADENPYLLITEDIKNDVTYVRDKREGERPAYPFGAYGPGRGAPKQLIEGPLELSPEELRVQAYLAQANGTLPQFEAQYAQLEQLMSSKIHNILTNTEDARRYAADESQPNRNDSVIKPAPGTWPWRMGQNTNTPSGGFGATSNAAPGGFGSAPQSSGGFGAPSRPAFGAASQPAFGAASQPTFGAPSAPAGGGFGAPSALGAKPSPFGASASAAPSTGFGAPSAMGAKPSPFAAQPSSGGFGAPSALGAKPNPFGGTQQPVTGAFGSPSTLGQKPNPFGGAQQPSSGGFGAPSQPAFGSTGFGSAAARPAVSPFASASTQASNSGPFGSTPQAGGGFGSISAPSQTNSTPFGSQQPAAPTSSTPFGSTQQAQTSGVGFGAPSAFGANRPSPFAASTQQPSNLVRPNPFAARPTEPPGTATFGANSLAPGTQTHNLPTTWKGKRIVVDPKNDTPGYEVVDPSKPNQRGIERIWFPTGPPEISEKLNAMTQAPASVYEDPSIGPKLKEVYEWAAQTGTFARDGAIIMPEIPPKREWCTFEL